VKVFTGDDELADSIDKQYVLDINKAFPKEQAAALKKGRWQVPVAGCPHPDHRGQDVRRRHDLQMVGHADRHVVHRRVQDVRR